ncbi:TrmH family RNA methyltransferase [Pasteurella canis]|uniref:TrmH family RNA methyltransferase n=1 Tax=Pasteurella canis TaxID=753 RepID=UPI00132BE3A7|nr:TrmH family RNA methyltransferase [Pasteurella canis]MXN88934.1 rRNA methyltransferase [Pasteurella canis]
MSNKTKSPVFQQTPHKKFNERIVGEKIEKNTPHFKHQIQENRAKKKHDSFHSTHKLQTKMSSSRHTQKVEQRISETTLRTANGIDGKVKVVVKSSVMSDKATEKKTGPLSPRAPEKIKKNRSEEMKVYGENACSALFIQRPESIVRVWTTVEMAKKSGELFSYLAVNKKVYHVVDNKELTLVSGTEHHGGICMLVKKARPFTLSGYLDIPRKQDCLVMIDDVPNAHNIGGIVRTCAVFGVKGLIVERQFADNLNSSAAVRVAEGGMEYIRVLETDYADKALKQLRQAGYQIVHLSTSKQASTFNKIKLAHKVVFVVSESGKTSLAEQEDEKVILSLSNPLNAELNIAVATGILLAKWDESLN